MSLPSIDAVSVSKCLELIISTISTKSYLNNIACVRDMQAELWSCVEGPELDVSMNGEILAMLHVGTRLISSHADGTMKVRTERKYVA